MGELEEKETTENPTTTEKQSNAEVEPKETDKMLNDKPKESSPKKSGEEIINIPEGDKDVEEKNETTDGTEAKSDSKKLLAKEDREVKPKKIPIGGMKLPGFFTKTKPKGEGDGADGELLEKDDKEKEVKEEAKKSEEKPAPGLGDRIKNFFTRKPKKTEEAKNETSPSDESAPLQKKGLLNAIKLPIANMIPRKKTDDDVEMGTGPGTKAGLASMETLDDSLKDQDQVDKAPTKSDDKLDADKSKEQKENETEEEEQISCLDRIRGYRCSVDDILIGLGVLSFVALLAVIGYVLSKPTLREGNAITSCGVVEGLKEDGSFVFRGIPYAVPPVNESRFKPAQPIDNLDYCWSGVFRAHNATPVCSQLSENGSLVGVEDCLHLDVVTPHIRYENLLPVVVLIGANSYTSGSPGILRPSARFARGKDVVFVRPNFRMGPLGFLAVEALTKDVYPPTSGNYALSDILVALKWIKLNIVNFGGDPNLVTLVGHRTGGTLVQALITSPLAKDLYTRAWVSSSSAVFPGKPLKESEKKNQEYMTQLECADAECLRSVSVQKLWDAVPDTWRYYPADLPKANEENSALAHAWLVLDGVILTQHPADVWKNEEAGLKLKLVIGTTAHESHNSKLRGRFVNWTSEEIRTYIEDSKIGAANLTDEVITKYNATSYEALVAIISDIRTICPLLVNARLQPTVPFYVVTQPDSRFEFPLADVDSDVQGILSRYEPHTVEQRRYTSSIQQLFYHYVSHGEMSQYQQRNRVLNVGQDPLPQEDYPNCNFWIDKDFVPRFARID